MLVLKGNEGPRELDLNLVLSCSEVGKGYCTGKIPHLTYFGLKYISAARLWTSLNRFIIQRLMERTLRKMQL